MRPAKLDTALEPKPGVISGIQYTCASGGLDEMVDATGSTRAHWLPFVRSLEGMGMGQVSQSWQEARHLIREYGVTYNVYGDARGTERPWELDPIPLLIPQEQSRGLADALAQRARLLELTLADLYGPQTLLREQILPPELIFANPGFLRPVHGVRPAGGRYLSIYAANLARAPDGTFWCLGDRTQAPSGAGYALKNRIVLSRMLPDVFRELRVERLAHFFQGLRQSLRELSPTNCEEPRVVLLTPGPYNETYFEHAFLARYLGFTLVEGADLTVRDNKVYLKLLEGLQRVDVIFRRLNDDLCDPLELRGDSFLGVPGLVHAVRQGNVAVANALGSGLVEAQALTPYLDALCRHLLSEDLRIPSVPTLWCGNQHSLQMVLSRLDRMMIKPAFGATRMEPIFGDSLTADRLKELETRLRATPEAFTAQEIAPLSTAPVLVDGRLVARPVVLRTFLAARQDSYSLMPGGLTRFSAATLTRTVAMQEGGGSKDTWMLSNEPVGSFSLLPRRALPIEITRGGGDLPSRVADNLFWLGRHVERTDGLTRLLRGILVRCTERSGLTETPELPALLRALPPSARLNADAFESPRGDLETLREFRPEDLLELILNPNRTGSLAFALSTVQKVAGMVRDYLSVDMWRVLAGLGVARTQASAGTAPKTACEDAPRLLSEGLDFLDTTVESLAAFSGLAAESMTRGAGWRFLDMGRRLERSVHLLSLLEHALELARGNEGPLLEAVLEVADSSMTYRRRYLGDLQAAAVLDLLLTDRTNPRSLIFQLLALAEDVRNLPSRKDNFEETLALETLAALRLAEMEELAVADKRGRRSNLVALLRNLSSKLPVFSDLITERYLSHLQASRHLGGNRSGGRE